MGPAPAPANTRMHSLCKTHRRICTIPEGSPLTSIPAASGSIFTDWQQRGAEKRETRKRLRALREEENKEEAWGALTMELDEEEFEGMMVFDDDSDED